MTELYVKHNGKYYAVANTMLTVEEAIEYSKQHSLAFVTVVKGV
jgi:hypothetical protein